jgi:hypothetical protein
MSTIFSRSFAGMARVEQRTGNAGVASEAILDYTLRFAPNRCNCSTDAEAIVPSW